MNSWIVQLLRGTFASRPSWVWLFIVIDSLADHDDHEEIIAGQKVMVRRGQIFIKQRELAQLSGLSQSEVSRAVSFFIHESILNQNMALLELIKPLSVFIHESKLNQTQKKEPLEQAVSEDESKLLTVKLSNNNINTPLSIYNKYNINNIYNNTKLNYNQATKPKNLPAPEVIFSALKKTLAKSYGIRAFADAHREPEFVEKFAELYLAVGREEFKERLKIVLGDDFKRKNCNRVAYLYAEVSSTALNPPETSNIIHLT